MSAVDVAAFLWLLLAAQGLNIPVGYGGQPMLGQSAFVAAGAYGAVLLADQAGWPLGLAVLAVVAAAGLAGWLLDFGTARLRGPFLALGTWGLAWLVSVLLRAFPGLFGGPQGLVRDAPARLRSEWLGVEWAVTARWHVAIAGLLCVAVLAATAWLRRSPVGLDFAALRDGPEAATSVGVGVPGLRRGAMTAAAALGALSGAGTTLLLGVVAPSDVASLLSIQLFVAVLLGGTASVWGPVAGTAVLAAVPPLADRLATATTIDPDRSRGVVTAVLLVGALALREPAVRRFRRADGSPAEAEAEAESEAASEAEAEAGRAAEPPAREVGPVVLGARGVDVSYEGLRALAGVDLDLRAGEVHALIGPNGSGKTTLLRVLAGALPPDSGTVRLDGADVTRLDAAARARRGVARTFQRTVLFPGLTVRQHVMVGARATEHWSAVRVLLATPKARAAHQAAQEHVHRALAATGLAARAGALPDVLDQGEQRLLQVARAAATGARVLLLDEPAAGMSPAALARLDATVRALAGNGVAVLLVEHNVRFVAALADRVTVLAEGRVLTSGTPADVRRDPAVRRAYLGEEVTT